MSKLFLLISLMSFISFEALAGTTPPKTNNSTPGFGIPSNTTPFGPKQTPKVTIPCQTNHPDCLAQKAPPKKVSTPSSGEDKVKDDCYRKSGNTYGDAYQQCLSDHGIFHVNRNINGNDSSQSDARLCYVGDPLCDRCLAESKGASSNSARRNQVANCIAEAKKPKTAPKPTPKPKQDPVEEIVVTAQCSKNIPRACKTQAECENANGSWDPNSKACAMRPCQAGTTPDTQAEENLCKCDSNPSIKIERGTDQVCPNSCGEEDRKTYNATSHKCECMEGYEDRTGVGTCLAKQTPSTAPTNFDACIREFQEKANSCNSAASTAVEKCDANSKSNNSSDTIGTMQSLLQGATGVMGASGAADNCAAASIAGSTGYYALEELRGKCDGDIGTCKTSCTDATTFINSNKQRAYEACRAERWNYYYGGLACRFDAPYQMEMGIHPTEAAFNPLWDADNKAAFDQKVQEILTSVASNNTKCESGTAVAKRDEMSGYMNEANNAVRSANQCQCQLSSGGGDCSQAPGPADCAANPALKGCAQATVNCNNASDTSPKCACFRNPSAEGCNGIAAGKVNASNASSFAGVGVKATGAQSAMTGFGGGGSGDSASGGKDVAGDLSGLNSDEVAGGSSSGTSTADGGSPFGAAGANGGISGGSGGAADGSDKTASGEGGEGSESKSGIRGLFETAKGALGSLFKDKKSDKGTYTGADGITRDANGNPIGAANKWRPRGMVRGLAGNDTEIAGKFEDIWKVMNKQYKVQDQKDTFIFGEKN